MCFRYIQFLLLQSCLNTGIKKQSGAKIPNDINMGHGSGVVEECVGRLGGGSSNVLSFLYIWEEWVWIPVNCISYKNVLKQLLKIYG